MIEPTSLQRSSGYPIKEEKIVTTLLNKTLVEIQWQTSC